jgi:hypothetical protein
VRALADALRRHNPAALATIAADINHDDALARTQAKAAGLVLCGQRRPWDARASAYRIGEVAKRMTRTVTLTEAEIAGRWDVEELEDGRLLLSRSLEPTIEELEKEHGVRLKGEEFAGRWGHLPRDGEG